MTDPRALKASFLLPLVFYAGSSGQKPSFRRAISVAPVRDWPGRPEPEQQDDHPADGEGSAVMFLGLGAYTNTTNTTATVVVHTNFSGSDLSIAPAQWLKTTFPLVASTHDFPVEPFRPPTSPPGFVRVRPDSRGHVPNLLVPRSTGSRSGRG